MPAIVFSIGPPGRMGFDDSFPMSSIIVWGELKCQSYLPL